MEIKSSNSKDIERAIKKILKNIGENPEREGLKKTPNRIARMFTEIFRGYDENQKPKITTFKNDGDGLNNDEIICDEGIFYSMCEHHMMPFFGNYHFAYIPHPKGMILGISKVARVVDYCAARLQIQERLASDIAVMIEEALTENCDNPPLGVFVLLEGEHLCKSMRGVKKQGRMKSMYATGVFKEQEKKKEAIQLFNLNNNGKI